jgi:hypothetical protein
MTNDLLFDEDDRRIEWYFETPAYTWNTPFNLKELETAEFWIDREFGTVDYRVEFRPDQDPCYYPWHSWRNCVARSSCETVMDPICYPEQPYCEGYIATAMLPKPRQFCGNQGGRPINLGYQFQLRVFVKGSARIRGILLHALPKDKRPFEGISVTCA